MGWTCSCSRRSPASKKREPLSPCWRRVKRGRRRGASFLLDCPKSFAVGIMSSARRTVSLALPMVAFRSAGLQPAYQGCHQRVLQRQPALAQVKIDGSDLVNSCPGPIYDIGGDEENRGMFPYFNQTRQKPSSLLQLGPCETVHFAPTSSGENLRDFASLIWKRKAAQGSSSGDTFTPPEGLVGVGVNCVSPTCVKEALQTIAEVAQASCYRKGPTIKSISDSSPQPAGRITANTGDGNRVIVPGVESVDYARPPDIALIAYPNSGEEWDSVSRKWLPGTGLEGRSCPSGVEEFGRFARDEWWVAGARVIGGCCRTRPAHIAELRKALSAAARDARYQSS